MRALPRQQQGITVITLVFVLVLVAFFTLILLRLAPIYIEHYKVVSHLENLAREAGVRKFTDKEVKDTLLKRYDIDDVDSVTVDDIFIERPDRSTLILAVEYEVRVRALGNVDMFVSFSDEAEVQ